MNSFKSKAVLTSGNRSFTIYRLPALAARGFNLARLPFSLKILLENLLRREDGINVTAADIEFLANWDAKAEPSREIAYMPARVLMQDFTGVPAVVDLAAMRDAIKTLGGDPERVNPLAPAELVIDHSVQVDEYGTPAAYEANSLLEFQRNRERYAFLKWGQSAFRNFSAVPPGMGICHQVNLEYLARVVFTEESSSGVVAYPDTLVGTDSHTTMINGLGVLGWGVGGIEAEAAMLGQPVSMLIPQVVGYKLTGKLREGATATDLVLTVTQALRKLGVVGKFVEFYGDGLTQLPLADRATIGNMAPEYGATCGIFPVDAETLRYLRLSGRSEDQINLVEAYYKEQQLFHSAGAPEAEYTQTLALDLGDVEPSVAGPRRPQDRVLLKDAAASFAEQLPTLLAPTANPLGSRTAAAWQRQTVTDTAVAENAPMRVTTTVKERFGVDPDPYLDHGSVVIAAITSCTNTSNPSVMIAAGLLAKKAVEKGLTVPPWVKTSLAPGSRVVTDYYRKAGLLPYLEKLRFNVVGYGCTTCIGNSGPLPSRRFKIDRGARPGCGQRSQRQSQLRGPHQCGRARQLSDEPAPRRRLRARRQDRPQLRHHCVGQRCGRESSLFARHLADAGRSRGLDRESCFQRWLPQGVRHGLRRRRQLARSKLPHRRRLPVGSGFDLHPQSALLRRHDHDPCAH